MAKLNSLSESIQCQVDWQVARSELEKYLLALLCLLFDLGDDMKSIFGGLEPSSNLIPSAIHLPKVDSSQNLRDFAQLFMSVFANKSVSVGLIMFIESARAFINLVDICQTARNELKG